jgi:hypothetical protein
MTPTDGFTGPGAAQRPSARELGLVTAVMALLAVVTSYPLILTMGRALPFDLGDPLLNTFILNWDADRLRQGLQGLWDAPFYFPRRDALAYSEHLLGIAIFTAPVQWLTGNPVLAYNVAHLASIVLAGAGMYLLARSLWGRRDAAWVAAVIYACAPYRSMQGSHLQVLMSGWMPIGLWGLHRYFITQSRRALAVFVAAFLLQALSNGYYLYFFALPVAVVVAAEAWRTLAGAGRDAGLWPPSPRRLLIDLAVAAMAIGAALAPVAAAYLRVRERTGLRRVIGEMAGYSALPADYLARPGNLWLWGSALPVADAERAMFPGLLAVVLAAIGLAAAWRSPRPGGEASGRRRAYVAMYAAVLVLAVWMSLGPLVPGPYRLALLVPGFDGLRVPARFIAVVMLALAALAGAGAAWIGSRLRPRAAAVLAAALALVAALEGYPGPTHVEPFDPAQPGRASLNAWLRDGPPTGVIELPVGGGQPEPYTLQYQFNTLLHGRPIVNGYSGFDYGLQIFLGGAASPLRELGMITPMVTALRRIGVRSLVLHEAEYRELMDYESSPIAARIDEDHGQFVETRTFPGVRVWRLAGLDPLPVFKDQAWTRLETRSLQISARPVAGAASRMADGDPETAWDSDGPQRGDEGIRIELDRQRDLVAVRLELPPRELGTYPRHLRVESEADDGSRVDVFSGPVLDQVMTSLVRDPRRPGITITLPPNRTRALRLSQLGQTRHAHWVVTGLSIWERTPAAR